MTGQWVGERGETAGLRYIEVAHGDLGAVAPLVIGLHGRGSNADDLAGLAPVLDPGWRYIFPQAPNRLDVGGWGENFSWYEPIMTDAERRHAAHAGVPVSSPLLAARERLGAFLAATHERLATPPAQSALIGFSQGAAMTLDTGLHAASRYAALVAMSGYLPEGDDLPMVIAAARSQPLLIIHGTVDTIVDVIIGRRARRVLETLGMSLEYREFAMGHEVSEESLAVVAAFLREHLGAAAPHVTA
ncbi:MAG TPA: hypothetical protein VIL85_19430 [Thermomicrobiales bacterium]